MRLYALLAVAASWRGARAQGPPPADPRGDRGVPDLLRAESNPGLEKALRKATGVYLDASRATDPITKDTVIVVSFNSGYIDFFENWICHTRRLGLKYLAWPDEVHAYEGAAKTQACDPGGPFHDPGCTLYFSPAEAAKHPIQGGASRFRQSNFNVLSKVKFVTVLNTLWHGAHVLFSDVDIAYIRDPWPGVRAGAAGADYVFQPNHKRAWTPYQEGNTGFHWFRARPGIADIVNGAIDAMFAKPQIDDQTLFWNYIRNRRVVVAGRSENAPDRLRVRALDPNVYPVGRRENHESDLVSNKAVLYHANWIVGHLGKQERLQDFGLWLWDDRNGTCNPFPRARYQLGADE